MYTFFCSEPVKWNNSLIVRLYCWKEISRMSRYGRYFRYRALVSSTNEEDASEAKAANIRSRRPGLVHYDL